MTFAIAFWSVAVIQYFLIIIAAYLLGKKHGKQLQTTTDPVD